eukprot:764138-Hanusia_phi.AAC.1
MPFRCRARETDAEERIRGRRRRRDGVRRRRVLQRVTSLNFGGWRNSAGAGKQRCGEQWKERWRGGEG